ncbi:histone-lysine N-methyltransferase SETMAR [Trichonephila clavipes]|nr:histone-lysine N-methyltransferase SETMAR [Trichonephila clavipes]
MWSMVAQRLTLITPPDATLDQLWQRVEAAWSPVPQEHTSNVSLNQSICCGSGKISSQVAEIVQGAYGADIVTANYVQFCFRQFRLGIFDVKDAPHTGWSVVENVDKITEMVQVDRHVSSRSIAQELNIDHKTGLSHLRKVGFQKKLDV